MTWQFSESCSRWKHGRLCSFCSDIEVVGGKDQKGRSGELLEAADSVWSQLLLFLFASFVVVVHRLFSCMYCRSLGLSTATRQLLLGVSVFLAMWLVNFFLLVSRGVFLIIPLHHIIAAVYTEPLFLTPDICFRVFNYGKVKRTFVSQLLRTSAKLLFQQVNRTFRTQTSL